MDNHRIIIRVVPAGQQRWWVETMKESDQMMYQELIERSEPFPDQEDAIKHAKERCRQLQGSKLDLDHIKK